MYLHLDQLKARILVPENTGLTRYDTRLTAIGQSVAATFDQFTGRQLVRGEGIVETFPGGSGVLFLSASPVETVTTVEHRESTADSYESIEWDRINTRSGILHLYYTADQDDDIRVTYTGGYWTDTSDDLSGTLPSGATTMPADLLDAWALQVDHEARVRKVYGGGGEEDITGAYAAEVDLAPKVERILKSYRKIV